ncbi:hypothetical protein DYB32_005297 [Aphanomyces invadans]|uniref:Carboxypeptidase n=1 Tax=Aphanomyces invadans TaxID=157072 RepID=A0A3R6VL39_9STRA|nr:hypothetical protein DYB32_005297 [Aphanomyces invadans]
MYAGRIPLSKPGVELFYWLVHSESDPHTDPLVLWLNGGPGCSSLAGLFTELGPFVVEGDLSVKRNTYAWNRKANLLFLESPAGVGFSSPLLDAAEYNEDTTTDNAYDFLERFFAMYPTYQGRPFYIMGESYAGRYIPYLVHKLVSSPITNVTLRGFSIGNPATDDKVDGNALMDYYYTHGMISRQNYKQTTAACVGKVIRKCLSTSHNCSAACTTALHAGILQVDKQKLNPYNIYGDVCLLENGQANALHYPLHQRAILPRGDIGPCQDVFTKAYLQLNAVQKALHVGEGHVPWNDCNHNVTRMYSRSPSALPLYPRILSAGLKALIYSGDADSVVNFIGTERWITDEGLNLTVVRDWRAWFGPDQQLAGYTQDYTNLTFKTVKGAGHMVAAVRPLHALYMFECFLYGDAACESFVYPSDGLEKLTGVGGDVGMPIIAAVQSSEGAIGVTDQASSMGSTLVAVVLMGTCAVVVAFAALTQTRLGRRRRQGDYTSL